MRHGQAFTLDENGTGVIIEPMRVQSRYRDSGDDGDSVTLR